MYNSYIHIYLFRFPEGKTVFPSWTLMNCVEKTVGYKFLSFNRMLNNKTLKKYKHQIEQFMKHNFNQLILLKTCWWTHHMGNFAEGDRPLLRARIFWKTQRWKLKVNMLFDIELNVTYNLCNFSLICSPNKKLFLDLNPHFMGFMNIFNYLCWLATLLPSPKIGINSFTV